MRAEPDTSRARKQREISRYVTSILLVCAASLLTLGVKPLFNGKSPLVFFVLAILFAAGKGGARQGFLATALSAGLAALFFQQRALVLVMAYSSLTVMVVLGVVISVVMGKLRRTTEALSHTRDQLNQANQSLVERAEALSKSNADLERFAYAVAHDLNAPLRNIHMRAGMCLERSGPTLERESLESLKVVISSAERMSSLIESLLALARVSHPTEAQSADVDTGKVAALALQYLRDEINSSGAIVRLDRLPVVAANEHQILRLFQNLLGNAMKYRSGKQPVIAISAAREGGDWRFSISDNGIGIDSKYHGKIFEPFQRLHSAAEYDGSGMGLAICKQIVEQHGGRIWVESVSGTGSRFCFTLPAVGASPAVKKTAHSVSGDPIRGRSAGA